jgi:hypothetical protein
MPAELVAHVMDSDASSAECPGTAAAPAAAPGHLCVYEETSSWGPTLYATPWGEREFAGSTTTSGAVLILRQEQQVTGAFSTNGAWAATAP